MRTQLKFLDRNLSLWIFLAMLLGVGLGYFFPDLARVNSKLTIGSTHIPLAIGLILMMYPPLAKVDFSLLPEVFKDVKAVSTSLLLNWIVGPFLMFALALIFMPRQPEYMAGLILIGLARCIAMVIVWSDLAKANREYTALLVALNSIFQMFTYGLMAWLFIKVLPGFFGLASFDIKISMADVMLSVLVYLAIPFSAAFLSRYVLIRNKGLNWYNRHFLPAVSPITLLALLFTIVLMFSLKADSLVALPADVMAIALPLVIYFVLMFFASFFLCRFLKLPYDKNASVSFTASGNNFELAIAVSIGVFGIHSGQALVGVIGPLVEVPVLILLVKASLWLKKRYYAAAQH
ncbi:ACR3 family arsenite efflux transporter [Pelobium manganitolerans]|uniref:ACR3 family arsenite efflux transporter n=1 Tax=Pelobium manganitolerans TaxID=1842495 RepID=UPI003FA3D93F